jgi:cyclase
MPDSNYRVRSLQAVLAVTVISSHTAVAQRGIAPPTIDPISVSENIYMLVGSGGNSGLSVGPDGALIIDDQFASMAGAILETIAQLSDTPLRIAINTHWHSDHTGSNEALNQAGAIIVGHQNVREMMAKEVSLPLFNSTTPPSPAEALPSITFSDEISFFWNGERIRVFHVPNAHTNTDSLVHFESSNVIHMGDTLWTNGYPRIDVGEGGGSLQGVIDAVAVALSLADSDTQFIPGHGDLPPRGIRFIQDYSTMLQTIQSRVGEMIEAGMTLDQVVAAQPTRDYDAIWGTGYINPDLFARIAYISAQSD